MGRRNSVRGAPLQASAAPRVEFYEVPVHTVSYGSSQPAPSAVKEQNSRGRLSRLSNGSTPIAGRRRQSSSPAVPTARSPSGWR